MFTPLEHWHEFYLLVGTATAALVALQFVAPHAAAALAVALLLLLIVNIRNAWDLTLCNGAAAHGGEEPAALTAGGTQPGPLRGR